MLSRWEEERLAAFVDRELGIQGWEQAQGKGEEDSDYGKYDFAPVHAALVFDQDDEAHGELLDQAKTVLSASSGDRDVEDGEGEEIDIRNQQKAWEAWDEKPVGGPFAAETHGLAALEDEEELVEDDRHKDFRVLQRTWEEQELSATELEALQKAWDGEEEDD